MRPRIAKRALIFSCADPIALHAQEFKVFDRTGQRRDRSRSFPRQHLGNSDDDLRTYYRTLIFTGTGTMPKFLDSDAEIIHYVVRTKGAIGSVSNDSPTPGVKVLAIARLGPIQSDNSSLVSSPNTRIRCSGW